MYKELIICIFLVICVVIGDVFTQNSTENAVNELSKDLGEIKEKITEEKMDKKDLENSLDKFEKEWTRKSKKMAFYIEHSELSEIWETLIKIKSDINEEEYSQGIENLDYCNFLLVHLKDKSELKMINIF